MEAFDTTFRNQSLENESGKKSVIMQENGESYSCELKIPANSLPQSELPVQS